MKTIATGVAAAFVVGALAAPGVASAFNSGSTGADGAYSPTVSTAVQLPPGGIFNFTSVNIPTGVTVTFTKNTANTPVVILATGDVVIAGTLNISGADAPGTGSGGDGVSGDDGQPGNSGPGGFSGGRGGLPGPLASAGTAGGTGLGSGGGGPGINTNASQLAYGGGGGGFGTGGENNRGFALGYTTSLGNTGGLGGGVYGSDQILPLVGGSGGGGGTGGVTYAGSGGGGGGGAILIAASGTVNISGSLLANGGAGGQARGGATNVAGGGGGGGSGGAIRIIATTLSGNGTISANGGSFGDNPDQPAQRGGNGGAGRIRLEVETTLRTAITSPVASAGAPGSVFIAGTPTLTISSVAGVNAPASPTGNADVTLPASTANPVTVVFTTSGVPVGNTVLLTLTPAYGAKVTALTPALTGTTASASASASVDLPVGPSVLSAQTTYTVVAWLGDALSRFANNERVEKVTLIATLGGPSMAKLITLSGKVYDAPAEALRIAAMGG
ncbi:MAG: hypothetical protein HY848_01565 [Betaproteobacteria bacterium]|nr:hypothetical protein [Betaproteobacteria bacterium]